MLLLMIALLEVGAAGATREHLVKKASIGTTTFYRVMKPLLERGLVIQQDSRYYLPLSEWYNYRFKLWHDGERLYQLSNKDRSDVLDIMNNARHSIGDSLSCLWLVGSAAHSTLLSTSDFDFLAVVREPTLYHPTATRDVNFVTLTEAEFRARFDMRDGFVLAALHYGLVLFDRDFAQAYCATNVPVEFADQRLHENERAMDHQRKRFFSHIEEDDIDLAATALETLAVSLTRVMLQTLGELPAGKPDLLHLSEVFFGRRFHQWLRSALSGKTDKTRLLTLVRLWTDYRDRFFKNTSHLKTFAGLPYSRGFEFEKQCSSILEELLSKDLPAGTQLQRAGQLDVDYTTEDPGTDLLMKFGGKSYMLQFKSVERQIDAKMVEHQFVSTQAYSRQHPDEPIVMILVANTYRSVPVAERSESFTEAVIHSADERGVVLLSGVDLLRAHNVLHLEETTPHQTLKQLLTCDNKLLPSLARRHR